MEPIADISIVATPADVGRLLRLAALPVLTYPRTLRSGARSASPATELDGRASSGAF